MLRRFIALFLCFTLVRTTYPAIGAEFSINQLPVPGAMVSLSPEFDPLTIKGLTIHPDDPFRFDFIVDKGDSRLSSQEVKAESTKLIKYFLASLAIPEKDLWVNLSPYEKDRIIPQELGQTELGTDLLAQDYILKQLTASLIYPEKNLGKVFWDRVYTKARELYGTTQLPVNTFNKVWIVGDKAKVYVHGRSAFVVSAHLKVMLEEDYLSLYKHADVGDVRTHSMASNIFRELIIPEIEKEVNTDKNFSNLRQIFYSMILATWYKRNFKEALLNQVYADKSKISGVGIDDKAIKDKIYQQYLEAYKKGVFNYIKEGPSDDAIGQEIPRKYFSGGFILNRTFLDQTTNSFDPDVRPALATFSQAMIVSTQMKEKRDRAMTEQEIRRALTTRYSSDPIYLLIADLAGTFIDLDPTNEGDEIKFEPLNNDLKIILERRAEAGAVTVIATGDRFKDVKERFLKYIDKKYWPQFIVLSQTTMIGQQYNADNDTFDLIYDAKDRLNEQQKKNWDNYKNDLIKIAHRVAEDHLGALIGTKIDDDGTEFRQYPLGVLVIRSRQLAIEVRGKTDRREKEKLALEIKNRRQEMMNEMTALIAQQNLQLEAQGFFHTAVAAAGSSHIDLPFIPGFDKEKGLKILKDSGVIEKTLEATGIVDRLPEINMRKMYGKGIMGIADTYRGNDGPLGKFVHEELGGLNVSVGKDDFNHPVVVSSPSILIQQTSPTGAKGTEFALTADSRVKRLIMSPGLRRFTENLRSLYYSNRSPYSAEKSFIKLQKYVQSNVDQQVLLWNLLRMRGTYGDKLLIRSPVRLADGPHSIADIREIAEAYWERAQKLDLPFRAHIISVLISDINQLYINVKFESVPDNQMGKIVYVNKNFFEGEHVTDGNIRMEEKGLQKGRIPGGQKNVADLVAQLFGLKNIKITVELPPDPKVAQIILDGGLESSSVYLLALLQACNKLTGANLQDGDLYALAMAISNGPVGDTTGGQGFIAALMGNVQMSFESGRKDYKGEGANPYGVTVDPLWDSPQIARELSKHLRLGQLKQPDKDLRISREGELIKDFWVFMAELSKRDDYIYSLHEAENDAAYQWTKGLRTGKVVEINHALTNGTKPRNQLTVIPINWRFDYQEHPEKLSSTERGLARRLVNKPQFASLMSLYDQYPKLRETFRKGLYSYGYPDGMVNDAQELGIGMYNNGAGGPESNVLLFAKDPKNYDIFMAKWGKYFKAGLFEANIGTETIRAEWENAHGRRIPIVLGSETSQYRKGWLADELKRTFRFTILPLTEAPINKAEQILDISGEPVDKKGFLGQKGVLLLCEYRQGQKFKYIFIKDSQIPYLLEAQNLPITPSQSFFSQRVYSYPGKELTRGGKRYLDKEATNNFANEFITLMLSHPQAGTDYLQAAIRFFGTEIMRQAICEEFIWIRNVSAENLISNQRVVEDAIRSLRDNENVLRAGDFIDPLDSPQADIKKAFGDIKSSDKRDVRDPLGLYLPLISKKTILVTSTAGGLEARTIKKLKAFGDNIIDWRVEQTSGKKETYVPMNTALVLWGNNIIDIIRAVKSMKKEGIDRLVLVSTSNVYNIRKDPSFVLEYIREKAIEKYCLLNGIRYVILRPGPVSEGKITGGIIRSLVYLFAGLKEGQVLNLVPQPLDASSRKKPDLSPLFAFAKLGWIAKESIKNPRPSIQPEKEPMLEVSYRQQVRQAVMDESLPLNTQDRLEFFLDLLSFSFKNTMDTKYENNRERILRLFHDHLLNYNPDLNNDFIGKVLINDGGVFLEQLKAYRDNIKDENSPLYKEQSEYINLILSMVATLDPAMSSTGGIDLNAQNLQMDITSQDQGSEMKFDRALIAEFKKGDFSGLTPVILNITPLPKNYLAKHYLT